MSIEQAILCRGLSKEYSCQRTFSEIIRHPLARPVYRALDNVDLEIDRGQLIGVLGPNGAGKTTLIKILGTLIRPTTGQVEICGHKAWEESQRVRQLIGIVFNEERSFYWRLTGRENLKFFATLQGCWGKDAARRIDRALDIVGLPDAANRPYMTYSTGMKQRLSIARALLVDPPVLLMDEPTNGLDPLTAQQIRTFIREVLVVQENRAVLLATNLIEEAEAICDAVAVLANGRCRAFGNVDQLRDQISPLRGYDLLIEGAANGYLDRLKHLGKIQKEHIGQEGQHQIELEINDSRLDVGDIAGAIDPTGARLLSCSQKRPSLIEVIQRID